MVKVGLLEDTDVVGSFGLNAVGEVLSASRLQGPAAARIRTPARNPGRGPNRKR
ncbi:hypothetical protein ABIF91_001788 [Bradyrhizobium sp. USDA 241]